MNNILCANIAKEYLEEVLTLLEIKFYDAGNYFHGPCPIHNGNNRSGLVVYKNTGIWRCFTQQCHKKYGQTILDLIKVITNENPQKWLKNKFKLGNNGIDLKQFQETILSKRLLVRQENLPTKWTRNGIRQILNIPAKYYLNRGYSHEILDKYDVGYYVNNDRVTVPIYNDLYQYVVGFTARSTNEKCQVCGEYHKKGSKCETCPKWINNKGFTSASVLYNYWFAKKYIEETKYIILCEGPGDVWRLEENLVHNAVALLGCELTAQKELLLAQSGALSVIIAMDKDKAGIIALKNISKSLKNNYRLFFPKISKKDVGDLTKDEITSDIKPILAKVGDIK